MKKDVDCGSNGGAVRPAWCRRCGGWQVGVRAGSENMNNPFFDQARDGCKKPRRKWPARSSACISARASTAAAKSRLQVVAGPDH